MKKKNVMLTRWWLIRFWRNQFVLRIFVYFSTNTGYFLSIFIDELYFFLISKVNWRTAKFKWIRRFYVDKKRYFLFDHYIIVIKLWIFESDFFLIIYQLKWNEQKCECLCCVCTSKIRHENKNIKCFVSSVCCFPLLPLLLFFFWYFFYLFFVFVFIFNR